MKIILKSVIYSSQKFFHLLNVIANNPEFILITTSSNQYIYNNNITYFINNFRTNLTNLTTFIIFGSVRIFIWTDI